jgi:hypothetical protein
MNASKIVVPSAVAEAIRHYTGLADTKTEAFTDILSMGFEGARSEIILRHFDGNHDELMEALICGYEIEQTPEDRLREYYESVRGQGDYGGITCEAIETTLGILGIKISGVYVR